MSGQRILQALIEDSTKRDERGFATPAYNFSKTTAALAEIFEVERADVRCYWGANKHAKIVTQFLGQSRKRLPRQRFSLAMILCREDHYEAILKKTMDGHYAGSVDVLLLGTSSSQRPTIIDELALRVVVAVSGSRLGASVRAALPDLEYHEIAGPEPGANGHKSSWESRLSASEAPTAAKIAELANELLVSVSWLEEVVDVLLSQRAVVFYGPPGTGKTFIARRLAGLVQPDRTRRRIVQFHPSYSYEDFFEGWRPAESSDAGVQLRKSDGPLRALCRQLEANERGVLLIDEMNRGNLAKVFGELYYSLEYREDPVSLMYSPGEDFALPPGLVFIGTMNTADRSVARLDQALRRRFAFFGLFPDRPPIQGLLERFLEQSDFEFPWLPAVLKLANERLANRQAQIGPSHFLRDELTDELIERIWRRSVLPSIEDQFVTMPERLDEFRLDVLKAAVFADATTSGHGHDSEP